MKNISYFLIIIFVMGCETDSFQEKPVNNSKVVRSSITNKEHETIVIRFTEGVSESVKNAIRAQYGVVDYRTCSCGDKNLESWDLEEFFNGATIEERVTAMEEEPEMEGADYNFEINVSSQVPLGVVSGNVHIQNAILKIKPKKSKVTIGVLDTGIDPTYFGFQQPFLHNSTLDANSCSGELFGWNFVDETNEPIDDNGHGTIVTSLIVNQLEHLEVDFDILPAKAFNTDGKGNLFNIACATSYLVQNKKVNMINMSFGWTGDPSAIIKSYIKEAYQKDILIVTSAGNTGSNNDELSHYPSSYTDCNILAVTAVDHETPPNLILSDPSISNYGETSVDIAVWGIGIPFYASAEASPVSITGSSYSSAKTTGYAALLYQQDMSVSTLYHKVLYERIQSNTLQQIKYNSYLNL